ncbi:hypothetical protein Angca_001100, partial [Angiostrongylus cantonensis]
FSALVAMLGACSAQLFTWPVSSYSPYHERYFAEATAPAPVVAAYPAVAEATIAITPSLSAPFSDGPLFSAPTYKAAPVVAATFAASPMAASPA